MLFAENFSRGVNGGGDYPAAETLPPLHGDNAPDRGIVKAHARRQHTGIGLYAVLVAQNKVIRSLIRVIDLLIRAALLDHEHRYAQFVYLEQLPSGELIKLFNNKFHFLVAL